MSVVARLAGGRVVSRLPIIGFTATWPRCRRSRWWRSPSPTSTATIFPSIILFGATVGNLLMLQPLIIAERFGVLDYPRIFSRGQFFAMIGTAGGPLLLGWLYDNAGGYETSYIVAAACSFTGALVLAAAGPASAASATGDRGPASQRPARRRRGRRASA